MTIYGLKAGTYKAYANTPYTPLDGVYLHGDLLNINKFDLVGCDEKLARFLLDNNNVMTQITAVLTNGKIYSGRLYWWHDDDNNQHGFVCDINDKASNHKAALQYRNRVSHLDFV